MQAHSFNFSLNRSAIFESRPGIELENKILTMLLNLHGMTATVVHQRIPQQEMQNDSDDWTINFLFTDTFSLAYTSLAFILS